MSMLLFPTRLEDYLVSVMSIFLRTKNKHNIVQEDKDSRVCCYGLENALAPLVGLYHGQNIGGQVVEVARE